MTNYNDGKWHGWNGGECPVHPESEIVVKWSCNGVETNGEKAKWFEQYWKGREICAFRVIKEHKGPREFWLVGGCHYECERAAKFYAQGSLEIIHVKEVME